MEQNIASLDLSIENLKLLRSQGFKCVSDIKDKPCTTWNKLKSVPCTKTALDIYCENIEHGTVALLNKEIDTLFEHEMTIGNLIEICGEAGSGKTQICFQLCINVQLPKQLGGREGNAMYLCTNYNFSKERLKELGESMVNRLKVFKNYEDNKFPIDDFNIDSFLKNISHIQLDTYDEFLAIIIYLKLWLKHNKLRLLIIDSITPLIQQLEYRERRHFIYTALGDLQRLSLGNGFSIVITNNITIRINSADSIYKTPALGEAYYHRINSRIILEKLKDRFFKAILEKSIVKKKSAAIFQI